jgi:hypothetical protein
MKEMILKWKTIFPIQEYEIKEKMTDKMLGNMIMNYSRNIKKLTVNYNQSLTMDGYFHLALLHSNLLELSINHCLEGGLCVISRSLVNLTSLSIFDSQSCKDLDSLSILTNLEKINLGQIIYFLDDAAVVNYSNLTKIKSIRVRFHGLSGLGLKNLVVNKQFLVQLKIIGCNGISSQGYHCLTTLTNLTHLTVFFYSKLDDIGLKMICFSCLLIEYLDVQLNNHITVEGLNNIHCLIHLQTLSLSDAGDQWLAKLSHNTALTHLDLEDSTISDEGLSQLSSSYVNLTSVKVNGEDRLVKML